MIDFDEAHALASAVLDGDGASGPLSWRPLPGGWRFWAAPAPGVVGAAHVAVSATGRTQSVPAGAPDHVVSARLAD